MTCRWCYMTNMKGLSIVVWDKKNLILACSYLLSDSINIIRTNSTICVESFMWSIIKEVQSFDKVLEYIRSISHQTGSSICHDQQRHQLWYLKTLFKLLSRQGCYAPCYCDHDLMTPPKQYVSSISLANYNTNDGVRNRFKNFEQTRFLCSRSMWPWPLIHWPQNQYGSSIDHGQHDTNVGVC